MGHQAHTKPAYEHYRLQYKQELANNRRECVKHSIVLCKMSA